MTLKKIDDFFKNLFLGDLIKAKESLDKKKSKKKVGKLKTYGKPKLEGLEVFINWFQENWYREGETDIITVLVVSLFILIPLIALIAR